MVKRSIAVLVAVLSLAACSRDADDATAPDTTDASGTEATSPPAAPSSGQEAPPVVATEPTAAGATTVPLPETTPPIIEVPETGVPGLDSDDAFCAAWSRFGGSWQVLAVGSSFLDDPIRVAEWEVAAAPVVADAYDDLIDNFPAELAAEAATVADAYFGVLARRSAAAGQALADTGVSGDLVDEIGEAWVAALAVRDPFSPELVLVLDDEAAGVVAAAAETFGSQRVEFHLDPSMVVGVDTPLTDAYLETACPDQGTLTGQEVEDG